jgi:hypothetical protein
MLTYEECQKAINLEDKFLGDKELVINMAGKPKNATISASSLNKKVEKKEKKKEKKKLHKEKVKKAKNPNKK